MKLPSIVPSLAAVSALCLAGAAFAPPGAPRTPAASADPAASEDETRVFSHAAHVPRQWMMRDGEQPRDCQGCHDYSEPDPARRRRPQDTCVRCHGAQDMTPLRPEEVRLDTAREALFDHYDHRGAKCQACHLPDSGEEVPDVIPVPSIESGAASCAGCHGPGGEAAGVRAAFNAGLDRRLEAREGEPPGPFRHDTHLTRAELEGVDPEACNRCHVDLEEAGATNLGEKQFSTDHCRACHTGTEIETELYPRPSRAAATFVHYFHLGDAAARANAEIASQRCGACHAWDAERDTFSLDPERFASGDAYAGCVTCHTTWEIENHGNLDDCSQCHEISDNMIGGRPRVAVSRPMPASFRIGAQRHRFITGEVDGQCEKCHVAGIDALPSRVSGRSFDHATHLGTDRSRWQTQCTQCHRSMAEALWPEDVVGEEMWEWSECAECHATDSLEPVFEDDGPREVLRFSHKIHLGKRLPDDVGDGLIACVDCHVEDSANLSHGVGLQAGAAACTKCHGHQYPTTPHDVKTVQSCALCHGVGVPEEGEPVPVERMRVASMTGVQRHTGEGACTQCHLDEGSARWAERPPHAFGIAKELANPHVREERSLGTYFEKIGLVEASGRERTKWCIDCHWNKIKVTKRWRDPLSQQEWFQEHPTEAAWRKAFGKWLVDYPGIEPR